MRHDKPRRNVRYGITASMLFDDEAAAARSKLSREDPRASSLLCAAMSQAESVSNLSSTSSRSEHMAYLMGDLNLDRATAALMYRAERLQEKGQLQQALKYFERVLATCHCEEAAVNARMIREQLAEAQPRLEPVQEEAGHAGTSAPGRLQTADMPVTVTCRDSEQYEVSYTEAMLRDAVLNTARRDLENAGIVTPFLEITTLNIEEYTPPFHEDPWMDTLYTCRAVVRATLLPGTTARASSHAADEPGAEDVRGAVRDAFYQALLGATPGVAQHVPPAEPDQEPSAHGSEGHQAQESRAAPSVPPQTCAAAAAAAGSVRSSGSSRKSSSVHS